MPRGPVFLDDYTPQLSGHETFPLRYGWLKKAFDAVNECDGQPGNKSVFLSGEAIARFGLGKNMVASMRHWAGAAGVIEDSDEPNTVRTTALGRKIFGKDGLDPYMEDPASLWMVHWQISGHPKKTTWYWSFNNYPGATFERENLVKGIEKVAKDRSWKRVSASTIKRDVECFVRTYGARNTVQTSYEDALESPLAELGLVKSVGKKDGFRFVRGPKATLGAGVFLYALIDFWRGYSQASTLSFEAIAHEPGSPGRTFLLDENDVAGRLLSLEDFTNGVFRWSETAGLKQVIRDGEISVDEALGFINADYRVALEKGAA
ncbi:DUF4007 family protein [Aliiroseovarius sp.]|uniref:DUF4007 family protein n=1 Tax=Aliiroseovarius sp. TaxID=1872442 RepID=UPI003BA95E7D